MRMRHFVFIFTLFAFLITSVGSIALADTCMNMDNSSSAPSKHAMMDMANDHEPCHEEANQKQSMTDHCDGMCLCINISINKAPLHDADQLYLPIYAIAQHAFKKEVVKPWQTTPLFRPPIQNA